MILAIDPGNTESAYVVLDIDLKPLEFGKISNDILKNKMDDLINKHKIRRVAIEMVASYGMAVGKEVFETVFWIGRFFETALRHMDIDEIMKIYRKDEKMNLCHSMKAKDSNIRQALIDRFGEVGTKKNPGWFYGFKSDIWQAYAVGVTYYDMYLKEGAA